MAHVAAFCVWCWVVVKINHVVEHANCRASDTRNKLMIELAINNKLREVQRTNRTHRRLFIIGVQRNLGAEV